MTKKLVVMSIMIMAVILNGMELKLKDLKRTKTVDQDSQSRRPEDGGNKQDVRLNLETIPEPLFSSANGKRSVKHLSQVGNLKSQQNTFRVSTARSSTDGQKDKRNGLNISNNNEQMRGMSNNLIVNDDNEENKDININDISNLRSRQHDNGFSAQDMWGMLKKANPKLYDYALENELSIVEVLDCPYNCEVIDPQVHNVLKQFGKKKSLSLDQMMEYAHLLESFDIEPEALAQLVQKHHNFSDDYTQLLAKKFKGIQKEDADKYLSLAFDFITRTCDDGGLKEPSPIHAAHVAIQKDQISQEKSQKMYSLIALALTLLTNFGGYAWAIYGQVTGTATNAPTFAPTEAPTFAPTMFNTSAPI